MVALRFTTMLPFCDRLDDGSGDFPWKPFRKRLETALQQERVLVIEREI